MLGFRIISPTITDWRITMVSQRQKLLNTASQMWEVLRKTREDIDKQFDENQSSWKPLRPFTVRKKAQMNADPRILHETKPGQGLRLRDAYAKTGGVDPNGVLTYIYPTEKPYAKEHQEGKIIDDDKTPKKKKPKKKRRTKFDRWNDQLDDEYLSRFFG